MPLSKSEQEEINVLMHNEKEVKDMTCVSDNTKEPARTKNHISDPESLKSIDTQTFMLCLLNENQDTVGWVSAESFYHRVRFMPLVSSGMTVT